LNTRRADRGQSTTLRNLANSFANSRSIRQSMTSSPKTIAVPLANRTVLVPLIVPVRCSWRISTPRHRHRAAGDRRSFGKIRCG